MIDVFVSRPTWVAETFRPGLEGFLGLLTSLGLNPRTLGATDYPSKAPLDEVIRLMGRCAGVVVLGYPQIIATGGVIKDQPLSTALSLPTEWNHIEAGLAYARDLPLLIIHHTAVRRGIFDRGAISSFIYELDLEDPAWPLSPKVRGALETWKRDVLGARATKEGQTLRGSLPATRPQSELSDTHLKLLKLLADAGDEELSAEHIAAELGVSPQKARYYLQALVEARYVDVLEVIDEPELYSLAKDGLVLLGQRNLL